MINKTFYQVLSYQILPTKYNYLRNKWINPTRTWMHPTPTFTRLRCSKCSRTKIMHAHYFSIFWVSSIQIGCSMRVVYWECMKLFYYSVCVHGCYFISSCFSCIQQWYFFACHLLSQDFAVSIITIMSIYVHNFITVSTFCFTMQN